MNQKEKTDVKNMILYLEDKVESCYKKEVKNAIKSFFKELKIKV